MTWLQRARTSSKFDGRSAKPWSVQNVAPSPGTTITPIPFTHATSGGTVPSEEENVPFLHASSQAFSGSWPGAARNTMVDGGDIDPRHEVEPTRCSAETAGSWAGEVYPLVAGRTEREGPVF